jgi:hypothetical protein
MKKSDYIHVFYTSFSIQKEVTEWGTYFYGTSLRCSLYRL